MPSKSKSQQRFFGMVDAYKKGELKDASSEVKKAAKGMSMSDVKDFAKTKHKGLPEKVEENIIRLTESDLHNIVKEAVGIVLEGWGSYVDYYYPDNEKEPKENNYFNPEKAKKEREPSKSSRVRRREYMKKKQEKEQQQ